VFQGVIDSVALDVAIVPLGGSTFSFKASGVGAPNLPSTNPVTVGVIIGDDGGYTTVSASF